MLIVARLVLCAVFGATAGVAAVRGVERCGAVRGLLFAFASANGALLSVQLTLFGSGLTVRTMFFAAVAVTDVAWLVSLTRNGPPADPRV